MTDLLAAADIRQRTMEAESDLIQVLGVPANPTVTDGITIRTVAALTTGDVSQVGVVVEHVYHDRTRTGGEVRIQEKFVGKGVAHRDPKDKMSLATGLLLAECRAVEQVARRLRRAVDGRIKNADDSKRAKKARLASGKEWDGGKKTRMHVESEKIAPAKKVASTPRSLSTSRKAITAGKAAKKKTATRKKVAGANASTRK